MQCPFSNINTGLLSQPVSPSLLRTETQAVSTAGPWLCPGSCVTVLAPQGSSSSSTFQDCRNLTMSPKSEPPHLVSALVLQTFGCFIGTCLNLRPELPLGWDAGGFLKGTGLFSPLQADGLEVPDQNVASTTRRWDTSCLFSELTWLSIKLGWVFKWAFISKKRRGDLEENQKTK